MSLRLAQMEQIIEGFPRVEEAIQETRATVDQITKQVNQLQDSIQSLKAGMGTFTKTLADLLHPLYNWMQTQKDIQEQS